MCCFGMFFLAACDQQEDFVINGYPSGLYNMTVTTVPDIPLAGKETIITTHLNYTKNGQPVTDLETLHERLVHNFITKLDFTNFAHVHNEDYAPLTTLQRKKGTLSFPYTFPSDGSYRMVSEFTHHKRSWIKSFDISVGEKNSLTSISHKKIKHSFVVGDYHAKLLFYKQKVTAGEQTEFEIIIDRNNIPVDNLELHLGSEAHVAMWRIDGDYFGHTHSYTPQMRTTMATMQHDDQLGKHSTKEMRSLMYLAMSMPKELIFKGPNIPFLHTFPEPGTYVIFIECAPDGIPIVFNFTVDVGSSEHGSFH